MTSHDRLPTREGDPPRVAVVVVHWRGMAETLECLESLARAIYPALDVIVVTNGREDFDAAVAETACSRATVVHSNTNLGFAGGCNLGAKAAIEAGAEFVIALNNDTLVEPQLVELLVAAIRSDPSIGVVAPVVTYADVPWRVWSAGGYLQRTLGYTRHYRLDGGVPPPGPPRDVDFVSGCALMLRSALWTQLGGMDERYFHYFEDADLCERARAAGYRICVVQDPLVRHKVSASAGTRGSNRLNNRQSYYFTRNRALFVWRRLRGVQRWTAAASQFLLLLPRDILRSLGARDLRAARGRLAGAIDAVLGRDGPASGERSARP